MPAYRVPVRQKNAAVIKPMAKPPNVKLKWPAQKIIVLAIEVIDPILAARIVMEAAIPMAKVHPDSIHRAYFELEDFSQPAPWGR